MGQLSLYCLFLGTSKHTSMGQLSLYCLFLGTPRRICLVQFLLYVIECSLTRPKNALWSSCYCVHVLSVPMERLNTSLSVSCYCIMYCLFSLHVHTYLFGLVTECIVYALGMRNTYFGGKLVATVCIYFIGTSKHPYGCLGFCIYCLFSLIMMCHAQTHLAVLVIGSLPCGTVFRVEVANTVRKVIFEEACLTKCYPP